MKKKKKLLHEKYKQLSLKNLAAISVKQGYLISKEEALKTKWFEESYLDDEVWSESWESIVASMQAVHPEARNLKPKAKAAPKVKKVGSGGENGKSI
tara:strand:+ start:1210 stop:1500 length:291 start_codon:yes stop_codon:yes gene_type:complete